MAGEFDPYSILRVLEERGVEYVVIGGLAATLRGSPHVTTDVDITPSRSLKNLARLSAALDELGARIRVEGVPDGVPFGHDAESLSRIGILNMTTDHGDLDITLVPAGTAGFEDLARDATAMELRGLKIRVASLIDVIRSKEAAGRPKDALTLPTLRRLAEAPEYVATAELLQTGQVLLSLFTTDRRPILASRTTRTETPLEVQVQVRGPDLGGTWLRARSESDEESRGVIRVRYPEHFEGGPQLPLGPGDYEAEWGQALFDTRRRTPTGTRPLASIGFRITAEGRFVPS
jgi:hypothetical protein